MTVSRWAGVALSEPEPANEIISLLVVEELQAHAVGVIPAAAEAVVFWQTDMASVVSGVVRFLRHCGSFYREADGAVARFSDGSRGRTADSLRLRSGQALTG